MRNPKRIAEIFELLNTIWMNSPDLRFNQLIYNLQRIYSSQNNGVGQVKETIDDGFSRVGYDFFHLEDDDFIQFLKELIANA